MSLDLSLRRLRAAAGVVLCAVAAAQGLVADLDTSPAPAPSSNPTAFLAAQGRVFFRAERPGLGAELFVTDGTAAGTHLVLDVHPTGSSQPVLLGSAGGRVWFSADDGEHGRELWVSDGTAAGTHLVVDVAPGRRDGMEERAPYLALVALPSGRVVFQADDGIHGPELWGTDGTQVGTVRLTDGPAAPSVVGWGGEAFFGDPSGAPTIFRTDGTAAGTSRFLDTAPLGGTLRFLVVDPAGTELLFLVQGRDLALWTADAAGNVVRQVVLPQIPHGVSWLEVVPGIVFFQSFDRVRAFRRDSSTFEELPPDQPLRVVPFGRGAVILGLHPTAGWEPWYSDGTAAGTVLLGDLEPNGNSGLQWVAELGTGSGVMATGRGLWATDGTAAGTRRIGEAPWSDAMALIGGRVLFPGRDARGVEPWVSDGTPAGTSRLLDLVAGTATVSSRPGQFAPQGAEAVFLAQDGPRLGLWSSDGTTTGTHRVATWIGMYLRVLGTLGGVAVVGVSYYPRSELFAVDGRTSHAMAKVPGEVGLFVAVRHRAFFGVQTSGTGSEPWVTDGTPGGTHALGELSPGPASTTVHAAAEVARGWVLLADRRLFITDGTAAGTDLLYRLPDATWRMTPSAGGRALLYGSANGAGLLWSSDGTKAGTVPLRNGVTEVFAANGWLYFIDDAGVLYETDGLAGSGRIVGQLPPGPWSFALAQGPRAVLQQDGSLLRVDLRTGSHRAVAVPGPVRVAAIGEQHLIAVQDRGTLFHIDAGDAVHRIIGPVQQWTVAGGRVLFAHEGGIEGLELWSYDPGASAMPLPGGCGARLHRPHLTAGTPRIGRPLLLAGHDVAATARAAVLWFGVPQVPAFPLTPGCLVVVEPTVAAACSIAGTSFQLPLDLPNMRALIGARLGVQAAWAPGGGPLGADLADGVLLSIGR